MVLSVPSTLSKIVADLTPAERHVAELILEGKTNPEIARIRGTSARTVANQAASLFRKLGVNGRAELAKRLVDPG